MYGFDWQEKCDLQKWITLKLLLLLLEKNYDQDLKCLHNTKAIKLNKIR